MRHRDASRADGRSPSTTTDSTLDDHGHPARPSDERFGHPRGNRARPRDRPSVRAAPLVVARQGAHRALERARRHAQGRRPVVLRRVLGRADPRDRPVGRRAAGRRREPAHARARADRQICSVRRPRSGSTARSRRRRDEGGIAAIVSIVLLVIGATTSLAELKSSLDEIFGSDGERRRRAGSSLVRARAYALGLILTLGFLLVTSLFANAALVERDDLGRRAVRALGRVDRADHRRSVDLRQHRGALRGCLRWLPSRHIGARAVVRATLISATLSPSAGGSSRRGSRRSEAVSSFGAAASLALVLLWFYYSAVIFYTAAIVAAGDVRRDARARRATRWLDAPPVAGDGGDDRCGVVHRVVTRAATAAGLLAFPREQRPLDRLGLVVAAAWALILLQVALAFAQHPRCAQAGEREQAATDRRHGARPCISRRRDVGGAAFSGTKPRHTDNKERTYELHHLAGGGRHPRLACEPHHEDRRAAGHRPQHRRRHRRRAASEAG